MASLRMAAVAKRSRGRARDSPTYSGQARPCVAPIFVSYGLRLADLMECIGGMWSFFVCFVASLESPGPDEILEWSNALPRGFVGMPIF